MIDMKILLQQMIINLIERMWLIFIFHYGKDRVRKKMTTPPITVKYEKTVVEELQDIEAENPNLYAALAQEDRTLIRNRNGKK